MKNACDDFFVKISLLVAALGAMRKDFEGGVVGANAETALFAAVRAIKHEMSDNDFIIVNCRSYSTSICEYVM